jgi:mono/diheme cytochrome c family protein
MGTARLFRNVTRGAALAVLAVAASGCGSKADYPPNLAFPSRTDRLVLKSPEITPTSLGQSGQIEAELAHLDEIGGKTVDPAAAPAEVRAAIDQFLKDTFGTPAAPTVALAGNAEVSAAAERLALTPDKLAEGGKLFRRHCLACHNMTGDGRGPTGLSVTPYPRDFRRGYFKFTSTGDAGKPRRTDILRTLAGGLKGTAMPSFGLLPDGQRELLAGYVTYLSLRGQVEYQTFAAALTGATTDAPAFAASRVKPTLAEWEKAESAPGYPAPPAGEEPGSPAHQAAVKRGYELFTRKADNSCISCHADFGRKPVLRYDVWGLVAKPADLTATALKGGARPEDVFARVRGGIPAVGMPAHSEFSDRQVWDLVRFVKSVPYPRELPPDVSKAVYPETGGAP